jgi:metallo-beta-lactamase family protein
MQLEFLGATGTVTGSKSLVTAADTRILVDCGLYQGVKNLRQRNWKLPPFVPDQLDAVFLTHAHIDHTGYLPALIRDGFQGPVIATPATVALCRILLPDSGRIHEEDAAYANRKKFSRHDPALPLYTEEDAKRALDHLVPIEMGTPYSLKGIQAEFRAAGHILGAASLALSHQAGTLVFSGDLGRDDDLLMRPPEPPGAADWIVVESTYGDRDHAEGDPVAFIAEVLERTLEREGTLLIPSFAVGRIQTVLFCLREAFRRGLAQRVPVYINSPMATSVTGLYERFAASHRLTAEERAETLDLPRFVRTVEESRALTERGRIPAVILSASGMATGGRVLHHLKTLASDPRNTILFPGFQAPGTRGDAMTRGAEAVKIHGSYVPVKAEVVLADVLSAHADREGLIGWVGQAEGRPRRVFVNHGEPLPADRLRQGIEERLGLPVTVPEYRDRVMLEPR